MFLKEGKQKQDNLFFRDVVISTVLLVLFVLRARTNTCLFYYFISILFKFFFKFAFKRFFFLKGEKSHRLFISLICAVCNLLYSWCNALVLFSVNSMNVIYTLKRIDTRFISMTAATRHQRVISSQFHIYAGYKALIVINIEEKAAHRNDELFSHCRYSNQLTNKCRYRNI